MAIEALQHYPVLRRLEITGSRLEDVESFLLMFFKAAHEFCIDFVRRASYRNLWKDSMEFQLLEGRLQYCNDRIQDPV